MQSAVYPNKAVFKTAPVIQLLLLAVITILHLLASFTSVQRQSFLVLVSTQDLLPSTIKNRYNAPIKSAIWKTTHTFGYYTDEDGYDLVECLNGGFAIAGTTTRYGWELRAASTKNTIGTARNICGGVD